jgi:hypothetical protein
MKGRKKKVYFVQHRVRRDTKIRDDIGLDSKDEEKFGEA